MSAKQLLDIRASLHLVKAIINYNHDLTFDQFLKDMEIESELIHDLHELWFRSPRYSKMLLDI